MDDLGATDSTLEGMGDNMNGGQNGQHERGARHKWMEYYNMRQKGLGKNAMDVMVTKLGYSEQG